MRLPLAHESVAVLFGVSRYSTLPGLPAVAANLADLRFELSGAAGSGFLPDRCRVVVPQNAAQVGSALSNAIRDAKDVLLVYYAGHGVLTDSGDLYLAVPGTTEDNVRFDGVDYDLIRDALARSPARHRVVILDCCYSGRAIPRMGVDGSVLVAATEVGGATIFTASGADKA